MHLNDVNTPSYLVSLLTGAGKTLHKMSVVARLGREKHPTTHIIEILRKNLRRFINMVRKNKNLFLV